MSTRGRMFAVETLDKMDVFKKGTNIYELSGTNIVDFLELAFCAGAMEGIHLVDEKLKASTCGQ